MFRELIDMSYEMLELNEKDNCFTAFCKGVAQGVLDNVFIGGIILSIMVVIAVGTGKQIGFIDKK